MVMSRDFQSRGCGFESRPDLHHLGVAQSGQSPWFGTRMPQVQILPPRPLFADVTQVGRVPAFQAGCCRFEAGRPLRLRRLARLACLSGLNPVMSETTWGFDPLSLRHTIVGAGKAPGCDPVRCRFEPGRPPQPFLLPVAQLEERQASNLQAGGSSPPGEASIGAPNGCSSAEERDSAKVEVGGSNPPSRANCSAFV